MNPQNEQDREIRNELRSIKQMEINVSYPFLMPVYHDYSNQKIDKTILLSVLRLVQSYVWRRFILGLPTNALNKIFMTLYGDVNSQDYLASVEKSLLKKKKSLLKQKASLYLKVGRVLVIASRSFLMNGKLRLAWTKKQMQTCGSVFLCWLDTNPIEGGSAPPVQMVLVE